MKKSFVKAKMSASPSMSQTSYSSMASFILRISLFQLTPVEYRMKRGKKCSASDGRRKKTCFSPQSKNSLRLCVQTEKTTSC